MPHGIVQNSLLLKMPANPRARVRLFCFPYAGGAAHIYRPWRELLPDPVDVCPVQPPGWGSRPHELTSTNMASLVSAVAEALKPSMDLPSVFFGHSLGALIAFELARQLRRERSPEPRLLLVSGCRAPQIPFPPPYTFNLPDAEFVAELRRLNGTPAEVLEHPELMELMLPLLRAHFKLVQTYRYQAEAPLEYPIAAFGGTADSEISPASIDAWREQTTQSFARTLLPGDHFFIQTSRERLVQAVSKELSRLALVNP